MAPGKKGTLLTVSGLVLSAMFGPASAGMAKFSITEISAIAGTANWDLTPLQLSVGHEIKDKRVFNVSGGDYGWYYRFNVGADIDMDSVPQCRVTRGDDKQSRWVGGMEGDDVSSNLLVTQPNAARDQRLLFRSTTPQTTRGTRFATVLVPTWTSRGIWRRL